MKHATTSESMDRHGLAVGGEMQNLAMAHTVTRWGDGPIQAG